MKWRCCVIAVNLSTRVSPYAVVSLNTVKTHIRRPYGKLTPAAVPQPLTG